MTDHPTAPDRACGICGTAPYITLHGDGSVCGVVPGCEHPRFGPPDCARRFPAGRHRPTVGRIVEPAALRTMRWREVEHERAGAMQVLEPCTAAPAPHPTAPARGERETHHFGGRGGHALPGIRCWCGEYHADENAELRIQLDAAREEAGRLGREWRMAIWRNHGCSVAALYGDDGEMQCGACTTIDFKRDTPEQIARGLAKRLHAATAEANRQNMEAFSARQSLAARDAELAGVREECDLLRRALRLTNPLVADWSLPDLRERYGGEDGR